MKLVLSEEQQMLQSSAAEFLAAQSPVESFRQLRDHQPDQAWQPEVWWQMIELGWTGVNVPEQHGGSNLGLTGLGMVMQEIGRHLTASPLATTAGLTPLALAQSESDAQTSHWLPRIAEGELTVALAVDEGSHFDPAATATRLTQRGDHWVLNGHKQFVPEGNAADALLVVARDESGLLLAQVDSDAEGLTRTPQALMDRRDYAEITFNDTRAQPLWSGQTADPDAAQRLEWVLDAGALLTACEMLGCANELFSRTVTYLKERQQFGAAIGSFQALQHRAARLWCDLQLLHTVVLEALITADQRPENLPLAASHAKCAANDTALTVAREAIQMHGGIAITDELDIGLYYKRIKLLQQQFGVSAWHRRRYAELCGI